MVKTQHLKEGAIMNKKLIALVLFVIVVSLCLVQSKVEAEDWSKYESGRNNIRLDGYDGQAGYVAFTDGDGTVTGYLWASTSGSGHLLWVTAGAIDLTAARLGEDANAPHHIILDD